MNSSNANVVLLSELPPLNPNESLASNDGNSSFNFFLFSSFLLNYFLLFDCFFLGTRISLNPSTSGSTPQQKSLNQSTPVQTMTGNVQRDTSSTTSPNAAASSNSPKKVPGYHIAKFPPSETPKNEGKSSE